MPTKILTINNLPTMINRLDERYIPGSMFYANVPIGTLISFAGNGQLPDGFLVCDGSAVSRTDYADLYDVIGTIYGTGDGSTTFNLPDYRGRFIEGAVTAGTVKSAGLPNIKGTFAAGKTLGFADNDNHTGAFYQTETGREGYIDGSTAYHGADTGFDASRSSSVYSDSVNTVQPASVTARVLIKALKSSVPDGAPVNFGQIFGNYIGFMLRQPDTAYAVGSVVYTESLGAAMYLECTTAGTTGATAPVITPPVSAGQTINDGTVVWTVRQVADYQTLGYRQPSKAYSVGQMVAHKQLPFGWFLRCRTAGTTSAGDITIPSSPVGFDVIGDGTVVWVVLSLASTASRNLIKQYLFGLDMNQVIDNADTLYTPGWYRTVGTSSGLPRATYGMLEVIGGGTDFASNSFYMQRWTDVGTNKVYVRSVFHPSSRGAGWSAWSALN